MFSCFYKNVNFEVCIEYIIHFSFIVKKVSFETADYL